MKKILYPILVVIAFLVMQCLAGIAVVVIAIIQRPELLANLKQTNDTGALMAAVGENAMGWAITISGIMTIAIIALLKMIDWKTVLDFKMIDWKSGTLAILGAVLSIFFLDIYEEILDLPNDMEDVFVSMSNSLIGALSIGIAGPIIEEFIFREGILGYMLRSGINKWAAITASALVFGIIHLNPAQIPFAAGMGIILGIIYYKTGNIVIPCILHILNNSVSVWMMYSMEDAGKDFSLIEWMGGSTSAISSSILIGILGFTFLRLFWQQYKKSITYETVS